MKKTKEDFLQYVIKGSYLECTEIDEGIKNVVDEINEIDDFVTMNSCQGGGHSRYGIIELIVPSQPQVLNNNYSLAEELFVFLKRTLGDNIDCKLSFEEDGNVIDDTFIPNGEINYHYRIESLNGDDKELLEDLMKSMREFNELIIEEK